MADNPLSLNQPPPSVPALDATGSFIHAWWYVFQRLVARTGGLQGISSAQIQSLAQEALNAAQAAQDDATLGLLEDDDTFAIAVPAIHNLNVQMAMADVSDPVDVDSIVLLSLALQDETP